MLKKVKNLLGIEGVKIELISPEEVNSSQGYIEGKIQLSSQSEQVVEQLEIKLIEKYRRGKEEELLVNEYVLSSMIIDTQLELKDNIKKSIDFKLAYNLLLSDMDRYQRHNIFTGLFVKLAKTLKNVRSYFRIEVSAKVINNQIDAIATKAITIT